MNKETEFFIYLLEKYAEYKKISTTDVLNTLEQLDLTEIINNEEYIINYYNIYYIFDNDKINKISDYSDYRFNKHIEFIKRRTFIKILLKDYEFKFREIQ